MINWIRPCGTPLTTNDLKATVEHCESKGWKREEDVKAEEADAEKKTAEEADQAYAEQKAIDEMALAEDQAAQDEADETEKKAEEEAVSVKPKRTRRTKEQIEADKAAEKKED